jgi:hypothetical protein
MNRRIAAALPVLLAALAATPVTGQDPQLPMAGVANRPAVRLETDFYAYGPGIGFTDPELSLEIDPNGFSQPVTLFLYWQDREGGNGTRLYFNAHAGVTSEARDLLSASTTPARIFLPALDGFKFFGAGGAFGPVPAQIPTDAGRYMFIFEVRNAAATGVLSRSVAMYNHVDGLVSRSGAIATNQTWTRNNLYRLAAPVSVQDGVTLTVEPGTVVIGSKGGQGVLVGRRGSQIIANGSMFNPIVMTSEFPVGERAPGDWGGIVMSGDAPANCDQTANGCSGEGESGFYGGDNPNGSCGSLSYLRVEFAGIRFSEENELNGIALQGCGSGTLLENVEILWNKDDGVEFFGGLANARKVLVVDSQDDSLDWTGGWQGKLQHFVGIQRHNNGNFGIEADNQELGHDLLPRSAPTIANATFIGNRRLGPVEPGDGMLLRRGTAGTLRNFIVFSFPDEAIEVADASTESRLSTELTLNGVILFDNVNLGEDAITNDYIADAANQILVADPLLPNPNSIIQPDVAPLGGSPARNAGNAAATPADAFFVAAPYLGGVDPQSPWTWEPWISYADN